MDTEVYQGLVAAITQSKMDDNAEKDKVFIYFLSAKPLSFSSPLISLWKVDSLRWKYQDAEDIEESSQKKSKSKLKVLNWKLKKSRLCLKFYSYIGEEIT